MRAFINCVGSYDSMGQDRSSEIRGLMEFRGKPAVVHTLENLLTLDLSEPVLFYVNEEHHNAYNKALTDYPVKIQSYKGPKEPLLVYCSAIKQLAGEHTLLIADDNLFDFKLEGLVQTLEQKDDNVLAARELSQIIEPSTAYDLNFGTCKISGDGKVTKASYSFDSKNRLEAKNVVLDLYLIHEKRTTFFSDLEKTGDLSAAVFNWYRDFYAWVPKEGFWADIGKPVLREKAEEYFNNNHQCK